MKKFNLSKFLLCEKLFKFDLKMKLSTLFLIVSLFQIQANNSYSLDTNVLLKPDKDNDFTTQKITVKGTITDNFGVPLPGANILEKGLSNGTQSDFDGNFTINVNNNKAILVISYVGYKTQEILVGSKTTLNIKLIEDAAGLDEVVIVSFGKQKKESVVASITTIKPSELNIPSSNLTTALAGRVSGLISYQRSGEPGADNAEFFIRGITSFGAGGNSPLILIDGIELDVEDLARLNPDDIESFSILKDASAAALYGARGANGVVYVTTKEGVEGPVQVNFRAETKMSSSTSDIELADPITYMRLFNEAIRTRDPLEAIPFSQGKIENTIAGTNPLLYPTVDWQKELFKKTAINKSYNFSVKGGGKTARYFVSAAYTQDTGILNVPKVSNFNNNIDLKKFQLRSNTNINLTPTSTLKLAFNTAFDDYTGPRQGGSEIYSRSLTTSPVLFQPYYQPDEGTKYAKHILFGNALAPSGNGFYFNPYADLVTGYKEDTNSTLIAQIEFNQDLKFITEGLSLKGVVSSTRKANYSVSRGYDPFYYTQLQNRETKEVSLFGLNPDDGSTTLDFEAAPSTVDAATYAEVRINYSREFNEKHAVGGLLVHTINDRVLSATSGDLQASLPFRNQGLSGRFTYGYDDRYFTELNFGYNGSERFAKSERWGFFPSGAIGWVASNEKFLENVDFLDNLKFKASYGLVGNDQIGNDSDRFFYISNVLLNQANKGFLTGSDLTNENFIPGVGITRYGNDQITWETGHKLNVGLELGLFNALTLELDLFSETRTNILSDRIIPASLGLQAPVRANIGEAKSNGVDASLVYNKSFTQDLWLEGRVNFTYAKNKITKTEEPDYSATPWRSRVGQPISQPFGYVAERLFIDQEEVNNSPAQFGEYSGGDIKYKDIDGNGVINTLDQVPIGSPTDPEIVYGFGFSVGYKGIDISCFFQGSANSSFFIDTQRANPFVSYRDPDASGGIAGAVNNQLLKVWADSHWSENNRDIYAKWPRLSGNDNFIENNLQPSTWFLQDGSFLRLKSIEMGYNLPKDITTKLGLQKFRIYTSATNLLYFSKFKLWDPELAGNGFRYPLQRVMNLGINISI